MSRRLLAALLAISLLAGTALWWLRRGAEPEGQAPSSDGGAAPGVAAQSPIGGPGRGSGGGALSAAASGFTPPPLPPLPEVLDEDTIRTVLSDDTVSPGEAGLVLVGMARSSELDLDLRLDALEHALNLLDDEDLDQSLALLVPADAPGPLMEAVMADLYERDDRHKLEACLQVLREPDHPLEEEAREMLEFYLDEDHGQDWTRWEAALEAYLES